MSRAIENPTTISPRCQSEKWGCSFGLLWMRKPASRRNLSRLQDINGAMAVTFARREVTELKRDMREAQATSGSTRGLVDSEQRRKDATLPLETAMTNLTNNILSRMNDLIAEVAEAATPIIELLEQGFGPLGTTAAGVDEGLGRAAEIAAWNQDVRDRLLPHDLMDAACVILAVGQTATACGGASEAGVATGFAVPR